MLFKGEQRITSGRPGGRVLWLSLAIRFLIIARSDEVWAKDEGGVYSTRCLTRADIAFDSGDSQLSYLHWRQADRVEVRFRGRKGDQVREGSLVVRTRDTVQGTRSGLPSLYGGTDVVSPHAAQTRTYFLVP